MSSTAPPIRPSTAATASDHADQTPTNMDAQALNSAGCTDTRAVRVESASSEWENTMLQWQVRDVMTPGVITVPAATSVAEIASVLTKHRVSGVPVVDRFDVVVGVISWKDLHTRIVTDVPDADRRRTWWRRRPAPARWAVAGAAEFMSAAPVTITPDATLAAAGRLMYRQGHSRLLVVDDRHQLLGIVTRTDLLKVHTRLDAVLQEEVNRALRRILTIRPEDVRVTVEHGIASLYGRTPRRTTALAAAALAEATPGVAGVVDHLTFVTDDTVVGHASGPAAREPLPA
jgi:CBS domain-containing protein